MPIPPFLAAALQFRVDVADVPANRERAVRLIEEAAAAGARLCVLPEMWSTGFAEERLLPLLAHDPGGPPRTPVACRAPQGGRRGIPSGTGRTRSVQHPLRRQRYGRRHGRVPEGAPVLSLGGGPLVPKGRFRGRGSHGRRTRGPPHLLRPPVSGTFPEIFPRRCGSAVRVVPVAFGRRAHWRILTVARAVEGQAYVVAANAVGPSGPFRYWRDRAIVSPDGERLASVGEEEGMALATTSTRPSSWKSEGGSHVWRTGTPGHTGRPVGPA